MLKQITFYLCLGSLLMLQLACTVEEPQAPEDLKQIEAKSSSHAKSANLSEADLSLTNSTVGLVDKIRSSIVLSHTYEDPYDYDPKGQIM